jgi:hypothetical protein
MRFLIFLNLISFGIKINCEITTKTVSNLHSPCVPCAGKDKCDDCPHMCTSYIDYLKSSSSAGANFTLTSTTSDPKYCSVTGQNCTCTYSGNWDLYSGD